MYSFDSLTLKYFYEENFDFINGAILQKIQLPSRYEVIFTIRNLEKCENKKLYININPKYPHICFINEETSKKRDINIPKNPPMFCMQLRKYLNGSKIKDFKIVKYERIIEFYFDYFDEIGSLSRLCLACELMGKHSNIILYNTSSKTIIGSIHNVSQDKSSIREIYGGIKYIYPPLKEKFDILNTSYSTFYEIAKNKDIKVIQENFYYFSQTFLNYIFEKYDNFEDIFKTLQLIQNGQNRKIICNYWNGKENISNGIDDYFSSIMFDEILNNKKAKLKKYILPDYKKLQKNLSIIPDNQKVLNYKKAADFIMCNLYNIKKEQKEMLLDGFKIELDENISLSDNAQKYYTLYKKSNTQYNHTLERYNQANEKNKYFNELIFSIENAKNFDELDEIKDELIDIGLISNEKKSINKPILNKIEFMNYDIYLGKNNKQNDYLISKIANGEDLWFHGLNFPSSHVILKVPNNKKTPPKEVMEFCAKLVKENSIAKNSGKTSIIMTKRKNLKKPPDTYLGYVTYKNEIEIVIE